MKTRVEKIEDFLRGLNVENLDILNYVDSEEVNDFDDVYDAIDDANGFDVEIIYYGSAMEYLTKNDTSLRESLEIASDMGFQVSNLSSEVLASLLASRECRDDFSSYKDEIDDFFNDLEDDEEEDEDEEEEILEY
jgi:hypothetical protein